MERLRKAGQLTARDWLVLGQTWALLMVIDLGLRLLSFRSLLSFCRWLSGREPRDSEPTPPLPVERLAWLTAVAGRYVPIPATCLKQALVLSVLLERRGLAAQLRIGVSRQAGRFSAHAWLEQNGRVILGSPGHNEFEPLFSSANEARAT